MLIQQHVQLPIHQDRFKKKLFLLKFLIVGIITPTISNYRHQRLDNS